MTNVFQIPIIQLRPYGILLKQKPKEGKNCGFPLSNNRRILKKREDLYRCSASRYVIHSWSVSCIKLTHNKKFSYPTGQYDYFVSPAEFHFRSAGHTAHEVADEISHTVRAVLRILRALPSFLHTF